MFHNALKPVLATAAVALLAACASAPAETTEPISQPVTETADAAPAEIAPVSEITPAAAETTELDLAMVTVDELVAAGNEQAAIDRLTQILGTPDLSNEDRATVLYKRATLRYGDGNDVWGAIADTEELLLFAPEHPKAEDAQTLLDTARGEATSLNFALENGEFSSEEQFAALFRLGQHQDAVDLMIDANVSPSNGYLVDLFQMGILCEGDEFSGQSYIATEPDGTQRELQFCDFGK